MENAASLLPLVTIGLGAALGALLRKRIAAVISATLVVWFFVFRKELFYPDVHLAKDDISFFIGASVMFVLMYGILALIGATVGVWLNKRFISRREHR